MLLLRSCTPALFALQIVATITIGWRSPIGRTVMLAAGVGWLVMAAVYVAVSIPISVAGAACASAGSLWLWWTGGGDDDTRRRRRRIAARVRALASGRLTTALDVHRGRVPGWPPRPPAAGCAVSADLLSDPLLEGAEVRAGCWSGPLRQYRRADSDGGETVVNLRCVYIYPDERPIW